MKQVTDKQVKRSFLWLQAESLLTVMLFSVPIFTVFTNSIGLSQFQVGVSQAIFMATAMFLDVPSGWLADRFSRKISNFAGDIMAGLGFVLYYHADSFTAVVLAEILVGAGIAFTNGADVALLKSYATRLGRDYSKVSARLSSMRPIAEVIGFISGGFIAVYSLRLTFLASAVMFFIGAIISLFIHEVGVRRVTDKHPLRDMLDITKYALHGNNALKWRILASSLTANVSHTVIWLFTPMLLAVGITTGQLGVAWAVTLLFVSAGSMLAHRYAHRFNDLQTITIPMILSIIAYLVLGFSLSSITIFAVLAFSLSRGWFMAIMGPMIQHISPPDIQATVISVSSLLRRFLYIPLVLIVNFLGNTSLRSAMIGSAIMYAVLLIPIYIGIRKSS